MKDFHLIKISGILAAFLKQNIIFIFTQKLLKFASAFGQ